MLLLKLLTVPAFLLLISLAGRRWGPNVAGWLAGFPVVVGPILLFLALEQGQAFAAHAAVAALSAVMAIEPGAGPAQAFAGEGWWPLARR